MKNTCYALSLSIPSIMPMKGEKRSNERERISIKLTHRVLRLTSKMASPWLCAAGCFSAMMFAHVVYKHSFSHFAHEQLFCTIEALVTVCKIFPFTLSFFKFTGTNSCQVYYAEEKDIDV